MSVLFLVPAHGQERLLRAKVAGLFLWERLYHNALRSGLTPVFIVEKDSLLEKELPDDVAVTQPSMLPCGFQTVVVCSPSVLPDISCLERVRQEDVPEGVFFDLKGMFIFRPSDDCSELAKAFGPNGFHSLKGFLATSLEPRELSCNGDILPVANENDIRRAEKRLFDGLVKDTEGFMSKHVERRISLFLSKRLVNTSITPNQITVISTIIGLVGAFFISIGQGFWQILGSLLFLLHSIVDGCDGEIARIKFMESRLGGVLDFWGDNIVHAAVFSAIGIEWARRTNSTMPLYLSLAAVIGTMLSASIVYFSTMRAKKDKGPLYTSVSADKKKNNVVKIADFLSRRDFIYLVVILAFFKHLDWFLVAASIGSLVFAGVLLWIQFTG